MPIIATENRRFSHVVKKELFPEMAYTRLVVTVNEAVAKSYQAGTVLGKVTAGGKFKIAVQTAVDGSAVGAGIVLGDLAVAAGTDTQVLVLVRGPAIVSKAGLVIDATYNDATKLGTLYADFDAKGVLVNDAV